MSNSSPVNNQTKPEEYQSSTEETHDSSHLSSPKDHMDEDNLKTHSLTLESHENIKVDVYKPNEDLKFEENQYNLQDENGMDLDDPNMNEQPQTYEEMEDKNEYKDLDFEDDFEMKEDKDNEEQEEDEDREEKEEEDKETKEDTELEDKEKQTVIVEDDDLVGLFEDSDELENQETKPVTVKQPVVEEPEKPEVPKQVAEVINTTLNMIPRPEKDDNLVICKFPPTLSVSSHPNDLKTFLKSNPKILENPPNLNNLPILCWKPVGSHPNKYDNNNNTNNNKDDNTTNTNNSNTNNSNTNNSNTNNSNNNDNTNNNNKDNKELMSNGKLVLWDDGSLTLFVGRVPLDCEFRPEVSFLLEDSRPELKPVHAQINTRLQTRFSNLLKNDLIKKNVKVKRQKMEVTSLSDAIQSQYTLQQNLMNVREHERSRRSHYSSKGLTKTFLESSDVEDDDELL